MPRRQLMCYLGGMQETPTLEFGDWAEFADPPLVLPCGGKNYPVPPIGIKTALTILHALDNDPAAVAALSDGDAWYRMVLGETYQQLLDDNVPQAAVDRMALTAAVDFKHGRVAALICWKTGQDPEALGRVLAATRAIAMSRADEASGPNPPRSGSPTSTNPTAPTPKV